MTASFLCPVLSRDILILDNYLTPRNGERNISEKCNQAGNKYMIALGTVSIFQWITTPDLENIEIFYSFWVWYSVCHQPYRNRYVQQISNSGRGTDLMPAHFTPALVWPPTRMSFTFLALTLAVLTSTMSSLTNPRQRPSNRTIELEIQPFI